MKRQPPKTPAAPMTTLKLVSLLGEAGIGDVAEFRRWFARLAEAERESDDAKLRTDTIAVLQTALERTRHDRDMAEAEVLSARKALGDAGILGSDNLRVMIAHLQDERDEAYEDLGDFGRHRDDCNYILEAEECSCGWNPVLARVLGSPTIRISGARRGIHNIEAQEPRKPKVAPGAKTKVVKP